MNYYDTGLGKVVHLGTHDKAVEAAVAYARCMAEAGVYPDENGQAAPAPAPPRVAAALEGGRQAIAKAAARRSRRLTRQWPISQGSRRASWRSPRSINPSRIL